MIEHIKLKDFKGIKKCYLSSLDKVNVLCGKNSSGKSSIMEAIVSEKNFAYGIEFGANNKEYLCNYFSKHYSGFTTPSVSDLQRGFQQYLGHIGREIVFSDEFEDCSRKLNEFLNKHLRSNYNLQCVNFFKLCFLPLNQVKKVLIPPKRKLEFSSSIKFDNSVIPNGDNLTSRLFYLKNQDPSSKDYYTYDKIYNKFSEISGGYYFNIVPNSQNQIAVFFSINKNDWIKADACGLGLSDLLVILSFVIDFDYDLIMVEEPENHLHPDIQRRVLKFFQEYEDKQFLLSTHSNVFLDGALVDKVFYCEMKDQVIVSDDTTKANILSGLGYTVADNLVSDLIVLTEGPTDGMILKRICSLLGLDNYAIKFWPLGGDIMDQLDLSCLLEGGKVIALIDSDPGSERVRNRFMKLCESKDIKCTKLERYSIENYLSLEAIRKVFPNTPEELSVLDPNKKVEEQLGFNIKNSAVRIMKDMKVSDFEGTDLFNFCKNLESIILS